MKTPIEQGMIARLVQGVRYGLTGQPPEWFSPMSPPEPVTTEEQQALIAGRQFDFPAGYNLRFSPRQGEPIGFTQMRAFADAYDLLRLVIETRKDQLAKLKFKFQPKDKDLEPDARCVELDAFFCSPDKEHDWNDWLRMLIEDMLVLDAATIYPRLTRGGQVYSFELVDGATITRKIDITGRTPLPPEVAYQQIIKGVPAVEYTRDELVYKPRNPRTHKVYGFSPVEQVIATVNIALRRQVHQLQYYTEGATPDLIFGVPETWNPDQIRAFQEWWNATLAGNTAARRGARFVPNGVKPFNVKEQALKDQYDEWLARIICYAFSLSPQALIAQMNRATAETAHEQALEEGLLPLMLWVKSVCDLLVTRYFGYTDIEFAWVEEEAGDPMVQAQINQIYINAKVKTPDEVRTEIGLDPMTPEAREAAFPMPVMVGQGQDEENAPAAPDDPAAPDKEAVAKSKKAITPIDREREAVGESVEALRALLAAFLEEQANDIAEQIAALTKVEAYEVQQVLDQIDFAEWAVLVGDIEAILTQMAQNGVDVAAMQVGAAVSTDLANEKAIAYARRRAAEMVGMRWVDGVLQQNPSAKWAITEGTRNYLRDLVAQAMENGWSNDRLAEEVLASRAFSAERAETIARTETARADVEGNMATYRESGVVNRKRWIVGAGCCPDCQTMEGVEADLDDDFNYLGEAIDAPPAHPNCRCDVVPIIESED